MPSSSKKWGIELDGFSELLGKLEALNADIHAITEKALTESHATVTPGIHSAMSRHRRTGYTEESIVDEAEVVWTGDTAKVAVGFDISRGGLPSIFLMYGTPKMKKDMTLFNSVYGTAVRKKVKEVQETAFYDALRKLGG